MNYLKITIAGLVATAVMSAVMLLMLVAHLPVLNFATLLAKLLGVHLAIAWVVHFAIGIFYAFIYILLINEYLPVVNNVARGIIYSILLFVLSSFGMLVAIGYASSLSGYAEQNVALSLMINLPAYFAYGAILGYLLPRKSPVLFPEDYKGAHPAE